MVRAYRLGMASGDYQFFFVKTTLPAADDIVRLESTTFWKQGDGDDEAARQGFENLLYVSTPFLRHCPCICLDLQLL